MTNRQKHLFCLFAWGVLIGILLEIIIFEKKWFSLIFRPDSFKGRKDKVTCLILVKHKTTTFVNSSKATWIKNCDYHLFVKVLSRIEERKNEKVFSKVSKNSVDKLKLNLTDTSIGQRGNSSVEDEVKTVAGKSGWSGLCKGLQMTKSHSNEWLLIVPDSSMVLIENLKLFVKNLNCDDNHYFGYGIQHFEGDYNVLSAGILLSRGSLNTLLNKFKSKDDCDRTGKYWGNEDLFLGKYLKEFGIFPRDTRDEDGKGRFHGFNLPNMIQRGKLISKLDYFRKALHPVPKGSNCCSPSLITMNASHSNEIYILYFFIYKIITSYKNLPPLIHNLKPTDSFWKDFLKNRGYSKNAIENMTSAAYYKIWENILPPEHMYNDIRNFVTQNDTK